MPQPGTGTGPLWLFLIAGLAFWLLTIPGMWLTFEKAGKPGWGAIVPFYNAYLFFEIGGRSGWWVLAMLVPLLNIIMALTATVEFAQQFGKGLGFALVLIFLAPVGFGILGFGSATYRGRAQPA